MGANGKLDVLIADDHELVRVGLASVLRYAGDFRVVGQAVDGAEAVRLAEETSPDVVVLDLMMPVMDGVAAVSGILSVRPETAILILTSFGDSVNVARALSRGARGALPKTAPKEDLVSAIRTVAAGGRFVAPEIAGALRECDSMPELTPRQTEVLEAVTRGLSNAEIARALGISVSVVKFHLLEIYRKLDVSGRSEAAAFALRKGLAQ